ncbi:hypothetical protein G6F50_014514 [Rhizopus delemar]|uniref:Uncharacterized protein n=1 Tax=Rhizopus delemar TaxID=936053 RepID=A0A9P7C7K7_9FUNG|nr:hypothetical protein G6F50_014514 [Rhizopus delemar]
MGLEHADRLARLHQQGLVVVQVGERFDDLVIAVPIAGGAADAAIDHQFLGVLGHVRVEVVHQHAQGGFGQPALGRQFVAARGTDDDIAVSVRLVQETLLDRFSCARIECAPTRIWIRDFPSDETKMAGAWLRTDGEKKGRSRRPQMDQGVQALRGDSSITQASSGAAPSSRYWAKPSCPSTCRQS